MIYTNYSRTKFYRMLKPVRRHHAFGNVYQWALWRKVTPILWGLLYWPTGVAFWLDMEGFYPLQNREEIQ